MDYNNTILYSDRVPVYIICLCGILSVYFFTEGFRKILAKAKKEK